MPDHVILRIPEILEKIYGHRFPNGVFKHYITDNDGVEHCVDDLEPEKYLAIHKARREHNSEDATPRDEGLADTSTPSTLGTPDLDTSGSEDSRGYQVSRGDLDPEFIGILTDGEFAKRIRAARAFLGFNLKEAGERLELSPHQLSRRERADTNGMKMKVADRFHIAAVYSDLTGWPTTLFTDREFFLKAGDSPGRDR